MQWKRLADYAAYVVVRILICIAQAMRLESGHRLAMLAAWFFGGVLRVRGKVVDENLRYAFPKLSEAQRRRLALAMWEHLFLMVLEIAHAPRKIHQTNWRDYIRLRGEDELMRLLLEDRPTLLTTAHVGNFEIGGFVLGLLGFPMHTVARTLDNPYLDRFVNQFRGATGQYIIPKNGGYDRILEVLGRGGTMTFLADQYAGPKGCWVEFFGRPASAHKAIALLSLEHRAPVVVACSRRTDRPLHFELATYATADPEQAGPEFQSVRHLTQWYTSQLEAIVRLMPDQYWWLHRRWKDTREKRPQQRKAA